MITKDTIVTKDNILYISKDVYEELYKKYELNKTINYLNITNLNNTCLNKNIHGNINYFIERIYVSSVNLDKKYRTKSFLKSGISPLINQKHYKAIKNSLDYYNYASWYNIKYTYSIPENLVALVFVGSPAEYMGFGRIINEKESKAISIIK
jgi:hypothetical protein